MRLLEKGLSQTLEIKCDLDVTDGMENSEKARYLSAIVSTLKNADKRRGRKTFYGTAALVSSDCQLETIERFQLVSGDYGGKKNIALIVSWYLALIMLLVVSYSFVIQPEYFPPEEEIETDSGTHEVTTDNTYLIEHADGTYSAILPSGREQKIKEEMALRMIADGYEVLEEEE